MGRGSGGEDDQVVYRSDIPYNYTLKEALCDVGRDRSRGCGIFVTGRMVLE